MFVPCLSTRETVALLTISGAMNTLGKIKCKSQMQISILTNHMTVCLTTYNLVPNETSTNKKLSITSICRMSAYCQTYKNVATVQDGNLGSRGENSQRWPLHDKSC